MKLKDEVMDLLRNLDKKNINLEYASEQVNKLFEEKSNPMSNIINDIRRLMDETKESDSVDHIKEKFNDMFSKVKSEDIKGLYSTIKMFIMSNMITTKSTKIRDAFSEIFNDLMKNDKNEEK